ncbi:MAG: SDR family oxidoreductase [Treponema sp.]|nr:SDR family oxidoreductase [Treponema sp.]
MKILVTGSSRGIGKTICRHFLEKGHEVIGFDILPSSIENESYTHYIVDVSKKDLFPSIDGIEIIVNNAGVQNCNDIDVNLRGTISISEKYISPSIKSVLNMCSTSAHNGAEFPEYSASKGGILAYTKNLAIRLAAFGATCNSISPGGVTTELNEPVMSDKNLWNQIMNLTPLKKWASPEEIAQWVYFLTCINKSATGIDVIIDNGENTCSSKFIWPEN